MTNRIKARPKTDMYYILNNDWWSEQCIGRQIDLINYVNYFLKQDWKRLINTRDEALEKFENLTWNNEAWDWLEIIIQYEI